MSGNRASTPEAITGDIRDFARDLSAVPPVYVPIDPSTDADAGNRARNIERQCQLRGGEPLFGRAISSADDLYLVGEWHCVISTPTGLIDVTPNPLGETRILFAAYPDLQDYPGLHHPNIRARIYAATERTTEVEARLINADDADEATARKNGITMRQLMLSRLSRDPLAAQIDEYLRAEGKLEAMIVLSAR